VHIFGFSRSNAELALTAIVERLPLTLELLSVAVIIALVAGLICAILAVRTSRTVVTYLVLALHSIPYFWLVIVLQMASARQNVDVMSGPLRLLFPAALLALFLLPSVVNYFAENRVPSATGRPSPGAFLVGMVVRLGDNLPALITASIITEVIFAWPGEGRVLYGALGQWDLSFVATFLLLSALLVLAVRFFSRLLSLSIRGASVSYDD
jgi:peptide/nickel transport system permease protein